MSQTTVQRPVGPESPRGRGWNPLRSAGVKVFVVVCVVALVAAGGFALWSRLSAAPQPYAGPATANDALSAAGASSSGGVWAIGARFSAPPEQNGATLNSSFVLRLAQGKWVTVKSLSLGYFDTFAGAAFISPDEGWTVGAVNSNNGLIYHYQHGAWTQLPQHPGGGLLTIAMVSPTEGWVGGDAPTLFMHLVNGVWTPVQGPDYVFSVNRIAMSSPDAGWAIGYGGDAPFQTVIPRYAHGSWSVAPLSQAGINPDRDGHCTLVDIATNAHGDTWAVGSAGTILHESGGVWSAVPSPTRETLNAVSVTPSGDAWAVGGFDQSDQGVILHERGGKWTVVTSPTSKRLYGVVALSDTEAWAVGLDGVILRYTNGAWRLVNGPA